MLDGEDGGVLERSRPESLDECRKLVRQLSVQETAQRALRSGHTAPLTIWITARRVQSHAVECNKPVYGLRVGACDNWRSAPPVVRRSGGRVCASVNSVPGAQQSRRTPPGVRCRPLPPSRGRGADEAIDTPALDRIAQARAAARRRLWATGVDPGFYVIDIDATLLTAHSDKQGAAPTYKRRFGHHPAPGVPGRHR